MSSPVASAAAHQQAESVSHVACKLPEFFTDDPELWFDKCESAFRRSRITTSITKFDYVLDKLPNDVSKSIQGLIRSITDATPDAYEQVKRRLVEAYKPSKWHVLRQVIRHPDLGAGRTSALLTSMMALLPPTVQPDDLFMALYMEKLPVEMREYLAAQSFDTPQAMAAMADAMWSARSQPRSVSAVSSRGRSPVRGRSPSQKQRAATPGGLCFYQARFGNRAHRCEHGCTWSAENALAGGGN